MLQTNTDAAVAQVDPYEPSLPGVYIHVPYCRVACPYCDFVKKAVTGDAPAAFADALCKEIQSFAGRNQVGTIFFGGGTPSLLSTHDWEQILTALHRRFDIVAPEISIEVNPDDVTSERAHEWQSFGITRVNIGVQSFNNDVLKSLGRCHDATIARRACEIVAQHFDNWGLDLIFGAPPIDVWQTTLNHAIMLAPPHLSTYGLTYEEKTPFWRRRHEAIDDDLSLALYREAHDRLAAFGFDHYEVSNYARPGYECRHNLIYWRNDPYIGFGPGAYSFLDGVRSRNDPRIEHYLRNPGAKAESLNLTEREIRIETIIQHCRTRVGLPRARYTERFGTDITTEFGAQLNTLVARGLLEIDEKQIRPTRKGYELNDEIGLSLVD